VIVDIININTVIIFGVVHRVDDGFSESLVEPPVLWTRGSDLPPFGKLTGKHFG
jgi:hypothetical protein